MKRAIAGLLLGSLFATRLLAQDAVAIAAQREAEENLKRLTATISEVQTAQEEQRKQITGLSAEIDKVRGEITKANNNAATQESLKRLSDQIIKVDERRIADNKHVEEALEQLKRLIVERPTPPSRPPRDTSPPPSTNPGNTTPRVSTTGGPDEGFEYSVQQGDRLDLIVKAYREQKIMVTSKMVMDANPTVKWERLKVGQKIFIPKPK